mmetsp:Transcript_2899/g.5992  ORF Transcript_2899/g.5992 Transcript_2899/m.5992 type:complete len:142 (-) Transcript_2899:210-635(-)|eukprot:scaffold5479_cov199-Amphora_coffeaeformis.AAC.96
MNVATRTIGLASRLSRARPFIDMGGCLHLPLSRPQHEQPENDRKNRRNQLLLIQKREYHATQQSPLVLYGTIILVAAAGYVIYRKSRGEPITPYSLTDAKKSYEEHDGKFSRAAFERRQAEKLKKMKEEASPVSGHDKPEK